MKKNILFLCIITFVISSFISLEFLQKEQKNKFEQNPPIAERVELIKLKKQDKLGNTYLFKAFFSEKDKALFKVSKLPISIGKETITLFNDGQNGDEKANDAVFSTLMALKDTEIVKMIEMQNRVLEKSKFQNVKFINRSQVIQKFKKIDAKAALLGRPIVLNSLFTASIFNDPEVIQELREKSLLITDVTVVEDPTRTYDPCKPIGSKGNPNGVWSFNKLVENMANTPLTGVSTKSFLIDWVDNQLFAQVTHPTSSDITLNKSISKISVIRAWYKNSGGTLPASGLPDNWQQVVKPEDFPVRLLAIVNRLDLRGNIGYGNSNAGEGRFVFSFVNENCQTGNNAFGTMTFIMEYGIPISNCNALSSYAQKWWILKDVPFGVNYNSQLEAITNVFTKINANSSKPNRSALNHFRTNDFISGSWEIRDFEITTTTKKLKIIPPNKEPKTANGFNNTQALASLIDAISNINNYTIPANNQGMSSVMPSSSLRWNSPAVVDKNKRREFSFNTCSSCHTGETLNPFTHIRPRNIGSRAALSSFLTGLGSDNVATDDDNDPLGVFFVNDVSGSGLAAKEFNETKRRAEDLENLVFDSGCSNRPVFPFRVIALAQRLTFEPLNMEH